MDTAQSALLDRIRTLLADEPTVREVAMFGSRAIMVREKMIVAAGKDGSLLVRVPAERHDELLDRTGAQQAVMGRDRDMGPGWIRVAPEAIAEPDDLEFWLDVALDHNRAVTDGDG